MNTEQVGKLIMILVILIGLFLLSDVRYLVSEGTMIEGYTLSRNILIFCILNWVFIIGLNLSKEK